MNEFELTGYLKALDQLDYFEAQIFLEEKLAKDLLSKVVSLKMDDSLGLNTAKLLGGIEAIRLLQSARKQRIEQPASEVRKQNG